ncbi:hypothetical protein Golomagni_02320 [Golovinomyces magnicellulatus]|nr:hypothetical protein Golomagni_02320 [Golovinomyces magnicellulatus]
MARSLPHSSNDEFPMIAQRAAPVTMNIASYPAIQPRPPKWAEARLVDCERNDWCPYSATGNHPPQPPIKHRDVMKDPDKLKLLSSNILNLQHRDLPALPSEVDSRSRANSFEYDDELRYSRRSVAQPQSYLQHRNLPPPPPPKNNVQRARFSNDHIPTVDRVNFEFAFITDSCHPDSLVPGRIQRTGVTESVFHPSRIKRKASVKYLAEPNDLTRPSTPMSYVSSRANNLSQKTYPFSKSVSKSFFNPRFSPDISWVDKMTDSLETTAQYTTRSLSDKPLPIVPLPENSQISKEAGYEEEKADEETENEKKILRKDEENEQLPSASRQILEDVIPKQSRTAINRYEYEKKQKYLKNCNNPANISYSQAPVLQLPNIGQVSVLSADIFSQISKDAHLNIPKDSWSPSMAISDSKIISQVGGDLESKTENPGRIDSIKYHVFDRGFESKNSTPTAKSISSRTETTPDTFFDEDPITSSVSHGMPSETYNQDWEAYTKESTKSILYGPIDDEESELGIQIPLRKDDLPKLPNEFAKRKTSINFDDIRDENSDYRLTKLISNDDCSMGSTPFASIKSMQKEYDKISLGEIHLQNLSTTKSDDTSSISTKTYDAIETLSGKKIAHQKSSKDSLNNSSSWSKMTRRRSKIELNNNSYIHKDILEAEAVKALVNSAHKEFENHHRNINTHTLAPDLEITRITPSKNVSILEKFEPPDHEVAKKVRRIAESIISKNNSQLITEKAELVVPSSPNDGKRMNDIVTSLNLNSNYEKVPRNNLYSGSEDNQELEEFNLPSEYSEYWASSSNHLEKNTAVNSRVRPNVDAQIMTPLSLQRDEIKAQIYSEIPLQTQPRKDFVKYDTSSLSVNNNLAKEMSLHSGKDPSSPEKSNIFEMGVEYKTKPGLESNSNSPSSLINSSSSSFTSNKYIKSFDELAAEDNGSDRRVIDTKMIQPINTPNLSPLSSKKEHSNLYSISAVSPQVTDQPISPHRELSPQRNSCSAYSIIYSDLYLKSPTVNPINTGQIPAFREILAMKSSQQRIQAFNMARELFATIDLGLSVWIRQLKKEHPDYDVDRISSDSPSPCVIESHGSTQKMPPHDEYIYSTRISSTTLSSSSKQAIRPNLSSPQNYTSSTNKFTSHQVQSKGKVLFHTAGVLGGKAGKAGKVLLEKSKNRLRATGSDKVD